MPYANLEALKIKIGVTSDIELVNVYLKPLMSYQEIDELEDMHTIYKNDGGCNVGDAPLFTHIINDINLPYGNKKRVTVAEIKTLRERIVHYWRQL